LLVTVQFRKKLRFNSLTSSKRSVKEISKDIFQKKTSAAAHNKNCRPHIIKKEKKIDTMMAMIRIVIERTPT